MQSEFPYKAIVGLSVILILFILLVTLPMPWNEAIENGCADLFFKIRGGRQVSEEIVFIYLGDEDIRALGGWPLTRDYFGYVTHILTQRGAKVVGFDFLFDSPVRQYPEFDRIFGDFIESSKIVCLPFTITSFADDKSNRFVKSKWPEEITVGRDAILPIRRLKKHAAGIGFSNLGNESVIRKVPLVASVGDSVMLAFGIELARLFIGFSSTVEIHRKTLVIKNPPDMTIRIPLDSKGRMRLNHFGTPDNISSMGFLDLLQTYELSPDSLNFSGKLVLVAATSSSLPIIKATPLSEILPASLIHATVAENIIFRNFLQEWPPWIQVILIFSMVLAASIIWRIRQKKWVAVIIGGFILLYLTASALLFIMANIVFPLFYPLMALMMTAGYLGSIHLQNRNVYNLSENRFFREQMARKHTQLEEAEIKLRDLEAQLQTQLREKQVLSEKSQELAKEKRDAVLALEKQLRDMESFSVPQNQFSKTQYREIVHTPGSKLVPILDLIEKIGSDDISVLIEGETGTGKELIARAIHRTSRRKRSPFVAINCGALPETLLESELFGHEKGSFTGAHSRRRGRFELAHGGTLLLDEITETSHSFQAKLLRVLQEGSFERLGSERTIHTNVRIIAATNKNLKSEVDRGAFREDLFYRLQGFTLILPPLRERPNDIPLLARHFLNKHGYQKISNISDRVHELMQTYHWPGNVRELENVIRRAAILTQSEDRGMIQAADLPGEIQESESTQFERIVYQPLKEQILTMLRAFKFSRSAINQTARALGNRDRGTITEYLRGICFESLVKNDFDIDEASREIAGTGEEEQVIVRVKTKMNGYLDNLRPSVILRPKDSAKRPSCYQGLPQMFHPFLDQIIENLPRIH